MYICAGIADVASLQLCEHCHKQDHKKVGRVFLTARLGEVYGFNVTGKDKG